MKWDQFFSTTNELTPNKDTGYCSSSCNFGHVGLDFIHVWFVFDFKYLDFGFVKRIGIQNSLKIVKWRYKLINQGSMYIKNLLPCRHVTGLSSHPQIWNMYHYQLTLCISTRGADYAPTSLLAPPWFSDLPTALSVMSWMIPFTFQLWICMYLLKYVTRMSEGLKIWGASSTNVRAYSVHPG